MKMPVLGSLVLITYRKYHFMEERTITLPAHVTEVSPNDGPGIIRVTVVNGDIRTAAPAGSPACLLLQLAPWQWPDEPHVLAARGEPNSAAEIERRFICNEDLIPFWGDESSDPFWERMHPCTTKKQ